MSSAASETVRGQRLEFPVRVESAAVSGAYLLTVSDRVRTAMRASGPGATLLDAGVTPLSVLGRTPTVVLHVRYHDDPRNDLGSYHEFGIAFTVRLPDGSTAVHIHDLPVDQAFTNQAGRQLWGFPKWISDMEGVTGGVRNHLGLAVDGEGVLEMTTRVPLPGLPLSAAATLKCVQVRDGAPVLVRAAASTRGLRSGLPLTGFRLRTRRRSGLHVAAASGERVTSADAARLRESVQTLGLERARALGTFAVESFQADFGAATPLAEG